MDRNDLGLILFALVAFGLVVAHRYLSYVSPPKKAKPSTMPKLRGYLSFIATLFVWVMSAILLTSAVLAVRHTWNDIVYLITGR
jgi:hypothetical protein